MARLWLSLSAMVCSFGVVGCFDAPPTYSVPERLPPVIDAVRTQPSTSDVSPFSSEPVLFNVFFRADDDKDEPLRAYAVFDLPAGPPITSNTVTDRNNVALDGRPFDEQYDDPPRTLSFGWNYSNSNITGRCHTVTLILSYRSNFNDAYGLDDPSLGAQVTWFLDLTSKPSADDTACWASGTPKVTQ